MISTLGEYFGVSVRMTGLKERHKSAAHHSNHYCSHMIHIGDTPTRFSSVWLIFLYCSVDSVYTSIRRPFHYFFVSSLPYLTALCLALSVPIALLQRSISFEIVPIPSLLAPLFG
ncbi:hypothetical protein BDV19DRAFT_250590 [Aspergillus venezuelensis]